VLWQLPVAVNLHMNCLGLHVVPSARLSGVAAALIFQEHLATSAALLLLLL
jgi:hypothetical protein